MKTAMSGFERVSRTLNRQSVPQLAYNESLWGETVKRYTQEGHLQEGEDVGKHFGFCMRSCPWINGTANLDFEEQILEETEETVLSKNGNYASLRRKKSGSGTPEHVDFDVKERAAWEDLIKPHLTAFDDRRLNREGYHSGRQQAAEQEQFFIWSGVGPFEQIHPVCGHEYMCMGMALDPDWIKDMVLTYANFTIMHLEELFENDVLPDGFFFYEDMGFKQRPFMSPAMYKELIQPGHKLLFDYCHSKGRKVIVHSCGFVEPLVPGLIEAGMDCLQAMEVKAGMDMPRLASQFGDQIAFYGNVDVRELISNDRSCIDAELDKKVLPVLAQGGSYILSSDHSIPPEVDYDTLCYFFEQSHRLAQAAGALA